MKAMRLFEQGKAEQNLLRLSEIPKPEPGPGQVLIRVLACGICHTDLHILEGDIHPPRLPITPGHQVVGIVEALGEGANQKFAIGDRAGVPWLHSACGNCPHCLRGDENLCQTALFTGFHVDGGYSEYMLAVADYTLPLPDSLDPLQTAPLLCAGIVGFRSLRKADIKPGERVGLVGFGASAHLSIQVLRHWECETYVFTRSLEHRQHACELGATWVGGAEDQPPEELDRAVIFAPAGWLVPLILEKLRPGGTLAINAIHTSPIPEMPYQVIYGERTLRSVANATYQDGLEFMRIAREIGIQATTSIYPLESAYQALLDLKHSRISGEAVLKL
ncbi:MAG TPA: zinc-dependent alcohol dehydrogenase family protein [Anaerolineales bacterium]|nr:zinc-dependent alcohol dehydrogenase family protein [Anaerolineales bacterium]